MSAHVAANVMLTWVLVPVTCLIILVTWAEIIADPGLIFLYALLIYFIAFLVSGLISKCCGVRAFNDRGDAKRKLLMVVIKALIFATGAVAMFATFITGDSLQVDAVGFYISWNYLALYCVLWFLLWLLPKLLVK